MAKIKETYVYGKSKDPRNWHETVEVLKTLATKSKQRKSSGLLDKLSSIETLLKEKK